MAGFALTATWTSPYCNEFAGLPRWVLCVSPGQKGAWFWRPVAVSPNPAMKMSPVRRDALCHRLCLRHFLRATNARAAAAMATAEMATTSRLSPVEGDFAPFVEAFSSVEVLLGSFADFFTTNDTSTPGPSSNSAVRACSPSESVTLQFRQCTTSSCEPSSVHVASFTLQLL